MHKSLQQYAIALSLAIIVVINLPFLPFYQHMSLFFTFPISFAIAVFFFSVHRNLDRFTYSISLPYLVVHLCSFLFLVYALLNYDEGLGVVVVHVIPAWVSSAFFCIATVIFYLGERFFRQSWYGIYLLLLPLIAVPIILILGFIIDELSLLS